MASLPRRHHRRRRALCEVGLGPRVIEGVELAKRQDAGDILSEGGSSSPPASRASAISARWMLLRMRARAARAVAHHRAFVGQRRLQHAPAVVQPAQQVLRRATRASVMKTSLKWLSSVIWRSGRTSTPGCFIGKKKKLMPLCFGHVPVGAGDQHAVVGGGRAGGPDLLAVDDVVVAVALGAGADAGEVGAGAGLGIEQAHADFALQQTGTIISRLSASVAVARAAVLAQRLVRSWPGAGRADAGRTRARRCGPVRA